MRTMQRNLAWLLLCLPAVTVRGVATTPGQPQTTEQAAPADPFLGRWELDPKASTYAGGSCPQQMTIEMTAQDGGIHYHSMTTPQKGSPTEVEYTARYDGRPAFVSGTRGVMLPVSLSRESERAVLATYSNGFQVLAMSRRSLSADGRTMTIRTTTQDKLGGSSTNVGVYRRMPALAAPPSAPIHVPAR